MLTEMLIAIAKCLNNIIGVSIAYAILVSVASGIYLIFFASEKKKVYHIELNKIIILKLVQDALIASNIVWFFYGIVGAAGMDAHGDIMLFAVSCTASFLFWLLFLGVFFIPIGVLTSLFFIRSFKPNSIMFWFMTTIPYVDLIVLLILKHKCRNTEIKRLEGGT